jgi:hypothetical protein
VVFRGALIPTLCNNLLKPPADNESNDEYFQKFVKCMENYKLPIPEKT